MKYIERSYYFDILKRVVNTPDIKVITGVRRSGKSKLLDSFKKYIEKEIKNNNVIYINYSLIKYESLKEYHKLIDYVEEGYVKGKNNFLLIDEVQMCKGFEYAINNFHAEEKFDIYITGSNAFLLSSDLATLFTGRTFEIEMFPFSFDEYVKYFNHKDKNDVFENYLIEGGMSGSYIYKDINDKYKYVSEVYNTLILRDIKSKYNIRNEVLLSKLTEFLIDNISNITSTSKIANTLTSNKMKVNDKTVSSYIDYLCNAFLFYKVKRYDIVGKKYLYSSNKYYLCDHSFRYSVIGTKNLDYSRIYENIVAMELIRRGYEIYVGILYNNEVDFVAMKRNEKIYIQVSVDINDGKTFEREIEPLLKIKDAYPKILISRTRNDKYTYEGIQIIDISNWLLEESN